VLIIALLTVFKPQTQLLKSKDARRKADLSVISKALEDYLNDNPCYPEESIFASCGPANTGFSPYLKIIPCDPITKKPYLYERPECQKYVIFADLGVENQNITYSGKGNYVVTSTNYRLNPIIIEAGEEIIPPSDPTATPIGSTPIPTLIMQPYGCFSGVCELRNDRCTTPNYDALDCHDKCIDPANECK